MDISRDLRRKMIMKLIEALKESPSFCSISDSHLNEAVLNSEHHTFQHSKSKDEYIAHINEKIRKIKQSTVPRMPRTEQQNEERINDSRTIAQKVFYEEDRSKIINGNIPSYVKVSQVYSHNHPPQPNSTSRKIDSFSIGLDRQKRMYCPEKTVSVSQGSVPYPLSDVPSEHLPNSPSYPTVEQHYYSLQGYTPGLYDPNIRDRSYTPQPQRSAAKHSSMAYSSYFCPASVNSKETMGCTRGGTGFYTHPSFGEDLVSQVEVRAAKSKSETPNQSSFNQQDQTSMFSGQGTAVYFPDNPDLSAFSRSNERNMSQKNISQGFHNVDQKPFQCPVNGNVQIGTNPYGGSDPLVGRASFGANQGSRNTGQQKMAYMFASSDGKFKTDLYSDKFNTPRADLCFDKLYGPFVKRSDPATPLSDLENDPRLVRNPSYRCDSGYDASSHMANTTISDRSADKFKKNAQPGAMDTSIRGCNAAFEYSYNILNAPSNRSFVGNVNPGLLNQNSKTNVESKIPQMRNRQIEQHSQADEDSERTLPSRTKPFNDKKSEELFRSFSEEFMKASKSFPNSQNFAQGPPIDDQELGAQKQGQEQAEDAEEQCTQLHSPTEAAQLSDTASSVSSELSDEYDDQIPERLQAFLDANRLALKEIESDEEWRALFSRVYQALKETESTIDPHFRAKLEIQREFVEFPFCDESDLKGYLGFMESKKSPDHLKVSKDDYLDYIDKAIESISEKRKQGSGLCWDDLGNVENGFSE